MPLSGQTPREIFRRISILAALLAVPFLAGSPASAGETDQYLTWAIELEDAAEPFNDFLEAEIQRFVEKMNRRNRKVEDPAAFTAALYRHLFGGLHASRVRKWLKQADDVDRHPGNEYSDWEYQQMSIFREPAFPFILPMAQTVRIGDVYLGIDKIGHMFGFGRRYLQIYQRFRDEGDTHAEALERVLAWGVRHELTLVGKLVDGIFSHGDLEANYQGFRMALAFCTGESPLFYRRGDSWCYRGGLDIRDYVTPDMDESFNTNDYAGWRGRKVHPVVEADYDAMRNAPAVVARFARYRRGYTPSLSKKFVDAWFDEDGTGQPSSLARN